MGRKNFEKSLLLLLDDVDMLLPILAVQCSTPIRLSSSKDVFPDSREAV